MPRPQPLKKTPEPGPETVSEPVPRDLYLRQQAELEDLRFEQKLLIEEHRNLAAAASKAIAPQSEQIQPAQPTATGHALPDDGAPGLSSWKEAGLSLLKLARRSISGMTARSKAFKQAYSVVANSGLFDRDWYLEINRDVLAAKMDPVRHYLQFGALECRDPNPYFDTTWYLENNPGVAASGRNPLVHYIEDGERLFCNPHPKFDIKTYLDANPQAKNDELGPLHHFLVEREISKRSHNDQAFGAGDKQSRFGQMPDAALRETSTVLHALGEFGWTVHEELPENVQATSFRILQARPLQVSVIVPTWNRRDTVVAAIDSILDQSYLPYEIIVCDDGSTDETLAVLHARYKTEIVSGLLKIEKNEHCGVSAARNSGLRRASGELIAYLDSDNTWRPHYLLLMASIFSECPSARAAYSGVRIHEVDQARTIDRTKVYDRKTLLETNFIDLNIFVHRRELFSEYGGFSEELTRFVDWDFIIRYTKSQVPVLVPYIGADYYLDKSALKNITFTVSQTQNAQKIRERHFAERFRYGLED